MLTGVLAALMGAPGDLQVSNIDAGAVLRYPMVLLKGTASGQDVAIGVDWKHMNKFPVVEHKFAGLVELKPGANMVLLTSGRDDEKVRLDYKPMTTPYTVAICYVVPDHETQDYEAPPGHRRNLYKQKLQTSLELLQCFTAEAMNSAGYGRKTFALDSGPDGKPKVHLIYTPLSLQKLWSMDSQALWGHVAQLVGRQFSADTTKCCAVMSFTHYDPSTGKASAHTALGGGQLGLFGGADLCSWPDNVAEIPKLFSDPTPIDTRNEYDDSAFRSTQWGVASTTLGAMIHEMGHTFGLWHSTDQFSVMSRGFDHLNRVFTVVEPPVKGKTAPYYFSGDELAHWDTFSAAQLNLSPWFQPDGLDGSRFLTSTLPTITHPPGSDDITVDAPYGLRLAGAQQDGKAPAFQTFSDTPPKSLHLSLADLAKKIGTDKYEILAIDDQGNIARLAVQP